MTAMEHQKIIRVGTRKSELALTQTNSIVDKLKQNFPELEIEVVGMTTTGDKILDSPLHQIGSKALFTKELEVALLNNSVDFVVHSLKDVPTTLPEGLQLGAITTREIPNDVLLLNEKHSSITSIEQLPVGSVIGTSSVRRIAQLKNTYGNLDFKDIRGNLPTRINKLDSGEYDGIILAYAGLKRLGLEHRISAVLDSDVILYAVGQGALGIECRQNDTKILKYLSVLNDTECELKCLSEREMLKCLEGGCSVPIGVQTSITKKEDGSYLLYIKACVCSVDGTQKLQVEDEAEVKCPEDTKLLGSNIAQKLKNMGSDKLLRK